MMAILPHKVTLESVHRQDLDTAHEFCWKLWPHTHGATWYRHHVNMTNRVPRMYFSSWSFQFEDDRLCFLLAWSHLEYKANRRS